MVSGTETKVVEPQVRIGTITVALDKTSLQVLKQVQVDLGLTTQSATLQAILSAYWWGKSSQVGHNSWPPSETPV